MATDVQIFNLATSDNSDFLKRVTVRLHKLAKDVKNEDPGTENHANRLLWAADVFTDPIAVAKQMRWDILSDANVYAAEEPSSSADEGWRSAKIEEAASGLINTYATGG